MRIVHLRHGFADSASVSQLKKKKSNYQLQIVLGIISLNFILLETPEVVTINHIFSVRKMRLRDSNPTWLDSKDIA